MAQGLKINTGTTFKTTAGVSLVVQNGNIVNNGNGDFLKSNVYLTGGTVANIDGTSPVSVSNLYINKPASSAVLKLDVNVTNNVVFQNGLLDLNGHNISLSPAGLLVGETEASRITGALGGYVSITVDLDAPWGIIPATWEPR